ncbi:MAG: tRNA (adenosine(37)-N6)-dimethylallyltransferase MiaA [Proteobacteria bacterium]|nr:tRNA (adenosine(37)-N6)-dimethylallyltransferase MiaA [Pseudomonadota bacterium]MBU4463042.1 tRNA (adenosine(37)-N6)-dimethylallyltransferase MiaA [Pseudomonadota bacterium]
MNSDRPKPKVIVICGPTGAGKTSAAIEIAGEFKGEIINADSMQIYKYMDIGTAKPTPDEQARVKHHMIDVVYPDESFDAAMYAKMARETVMKLDRQDTVSFIVGGTGFYIKALLHGLFIGPAKGGDVNARECLKGEAAVHGAAFLHRRLSKCDPTAAENIHPNDTYRIIRALEVYEITGKSISEHHEEHRFTDEPFKVLTIGLDMNREILYDRINSRVDAMIDAGLVDEVKWLLHKGYSENLKPMQSIGYRHAVDYIKGRLTWDEALSTLKRDTRRYAKRQLTWFKADLRIAWIKPEQLKNIVRLIKKFLSVT